MKSINEITRVLPTCDAPAVETENRNPPPTVAIAVAKANDATPIAEPISKSLNQPS